MTAFNVVRFRIRPGREEEFLDAHRNGRAGWPGLVAGHLVRTGERSYCLIGQWTDTAAIAGARAEMIATLNGFRDTLEDLGDGRGVTDAVSGESVVDLLA
jgi:quinol monooxygenase YgiN